MAGRQNGTASAPPEYRSPFDNDTHVGEDTPLLAKAVTGINAGANGNDATKQPPWDWESDFEGHSWYRKPSIWWLIPCYALYSAAFGGIIVPKLNLVLSLVCQKYISDKASRQSPGGGDPFLPVIMLANDPQCRIPEVQALATEFTLYLNLVGGILSAVVSPKIGALSDRYGRKNFLAFSVFGGLLYEIVTILAATYPDTVHYTWMLFGAFLDGMCGSVGAAMAMTHSFAADVTTPAKRGVAFGYFHACLFGGMALGPLVGAYVSTVTGSLLSVFWLALACHATVMVFLIFLVPESLSHKRQLEARDRHSAELETAISSSSGPSSIFQTLRSANILEPLKVLYPTGPGSSPQVRTNLILLSSVNTLLYGVAIGTGTVIVFYTNFAFNWGDVETQIFVGITSGFRVLVLVAVLPLLTYVFRTRLENKKRRLRLARLVSPPDPTTNPATETAVDADDDDTRTPGADTLDLSMIRGALVIEILCYAGFSVIQHGGLFFACGVLSAGGGIAGPVLQSALSKHITPDRVGQLLGAVALLNGLAKVVCPAVFGFLYAATVATLPQMVFVVLCATFVVAGGLSLFIVPHVYLEDERTTATYPATTTTTAADEELNYLLADELLDDEVIVRA